MTTIEKSKWKEQWERGDQIPGGNQGHTFLARRASDTSSDFGYVLKTLKRQDDADRRARFSIEVACLRTVEHESVARLIDSNADQFNDLVELYLVVERIKGPDLGVYVTDNDVDVETAINITERVLKTLRHCHGRNVIHRDIKPCHIILRNGDVNDPVLIDFGLAFNEDAQPSEFRTESGQGVGNRFIVLPEQLGDGQEKRDQRSDITQCLGVLLFLMSGEAPGIINDPRGQKPHEKPQVARHLKQVANELQQRQLSRIFSLGFEWDPGKRWQSADALLREIGKFASASGEDSQISFDDRLDGLLDRINSNPQTEIFDRLNQLFGEFESKIQTVASRVQSRFKDHISIGVNKLNRDMRKHAFLTGVATHNKRQQERNATVEIVARLEVTEIHIRSMLKSNPKSDETAEVPHDMRLSLFDDAIAEEFTRICEDCVVACIERITT